MTELSKQIFDPPEKRASHLSFLRELWLITIFSITITALVSHVFTDYIPLHHDLAGSILSGKLAFELGEVYSNYSIYFPPAEKLWFTLFAIVSDATGWSLILTASLLINLMTVIACLLAYQVRRMTLGGSPVFFFVSVAALTLLPMIFKNVFGLREHMVILGLWPYLVLRCSEHSSKPIDWQWRTVIGLWLGANLLFKYLYCVVVILVELAEAISIRRIATIFRIENLISGCVVALYLFLWLGLNPDQRDAIGAMLSSIDANLKNPLANVLNALNYLIFIPAVILSSTINGVERKSWMIGVALVVGAVIVAALQERWYSHHLFPIIMAYVFWWWQAKPKLRLWLNALVVICLAYPFINQLLNARSYIDRVNEVEAVFSNSGYSLTGRRVGMLNMHPSPYNQVLTSFNATRWNPMMNLAYPAAELKVYDKPANANAFAPPLTFDNRGRRMLHDQMISLWQDQPPEFLLFDHTSRFPLKYMNIDWERLFSRDPRFQEILQHYKPVIQHDGRLTKFTVYVRVD